MKLSLTVADTLHAFVLNRKLSNLSARTLEGDERRLNDFGRIALVPGSWQPHFLLPRPLWSRTE